MTDWTSGISELFGTTKPVPAQPKNYDTIEISATGNNSKYAEAALTAECEIVASTASYRNDQLNLSAYKIGGYVGANEISERRCYEALVAAGLAAGLEPQEVPATVSSGLRKGKLKPTPAPLPTTPRAIPKPDIDKEDPIDPPETPKRRLGVRTAASISTKRVRWLWHDRIPLGEICLIAGREGVGKSTYLADLAAQITDGRCKGEYEGEPKAVIYLANEDSWAYTVVPRMMAAGADLNRIFQVEAVEGEGGLMLPKDCNEVAELALELNAAAIMCDPIISLIDDRLSTDRARELRQALEPLRRAAEKADCAVPALVHFNKGDGDVLTKISGSRGWVEVARAAIGLAKDKENGYCVLSQIKNNLGRLDLSNWSYEIESTELQVSDGSWTNVGRIKWLEKVEQGVEDVMAAAKQQGAGRPRSESSNAIIDFVVDHGPVSVQEVLAHFDDLDERVIRNALASGVQRKELSRPHTGVYAPPA